MVQLSNQHTIMVYGMYRKQAKYAQWILILYQDAKIKRKSDFERGFIVGERMASVSKTAQLASVSTGTVTKVSMHLANHILWPLQSQDLNPIEHLRKILI